MRVFNFLHYFVALSLYVVCASTHSTTTRRNNGLSKLYAKPKPGPNPSSFPSIAPSANPSIPPTAIPTIPPTSLPTNPTAIPTAIPTTPTVQPTALPSKSEPKPKPSPKPTDSKAPASPVKPKPKPKPIASLRRVAANNVVSSRIMLDAVSSLQQFEIEKIEHIVESEDEPSQVCLADQ